MLDGGSDGDNGKRVSDVGTRDGEIKIRNCIHTFIVSEETVEKDARDEVRGCHGTRERTSIRDGPGRHTRQELHFTELDKLGITGHTGSIANTADTALTALCGPKSWCF